MYKFIFTLFLSLSICEKDLDALIFQNFQKFIKKYKKNYTSLNEYLARFQVFKRNILQLTSNEKASYATGITKFSDMTKQEFSKIYLNLNYDAIAMANFEPYYVQTMNAAPSSYDWRNYNSVCLVQDQGSCGACWAFSTVGNLEGQYAFKKGYCIKLSEQMLIDCDTSDSGCNGGLMEYAFTFLKKFGGICLAEDYPYTGVKGTCNCPQDKMVDMTITGYKKLGSPYSTWPFVDEDEIKEFLYQTGPLSIAINADPLQTYSSGIIDIPPSECPSTGINHAVLLVGYGHDSSIEKDYWLIKNSWGKSWGESGYFRIRRGINTCGVNCYITTAVVSF